MGSDKIATGLKRGVRCTRSRMMATLSIAVRQTRYLLPHWAAIGIVWLGILVLSPFGRHLVHAGGWENRDGRSTENPDTIALVRVTVTRATAERLCGRGRIGKLLLYECRIEDAAPTSVAPPVVVLTLVPATAALPALRASVAYAARQTTAAAMPLFSYPTCPPPVFLNLRHMLWFPANG